MALFIYVCFPKTNKVCGNSRMLTFSSRHCQQGIEDLNLYFIFPIRPNGASFPLGIISFSIFRGLIFVCIFTKTCHIDPWGRPKVTAGSDHYFRTCCPYVRPHFSKSHKTKQSSNEDSDLVIATGGTVGLSE